MKLSVYEYESWPDGGYVETKSLIRQEIYKSSVGLIFVCRNKKLNKERDIQEFCATHICM